MITGVHTAQDVATKGESMLKEKPIEQFIR